MEEKRERTNSFTVKQDGRGGYQMGGLRKGGVLPRNKDWQEVRGSISPEAVQSPKFSPDGCIVDFDGKKCPFAVLSICPVILGSVMALQCPLCQLYALFPNVLL